MTSSKWNDDQFDALEAWVDAKISMNEASNHPDHWEEREYKTDQEWKARIRLMNLLGVT
jgi:hypothetical protein